MRLLRRGIEPRTSLGPGELEGRLPRPSIRSMAEPPVTRGAVRGRGRPPQAQAHGGALLVARSSLTALSIEPTGIVGARRTRLRRLTSEESLLLGVPHLRGGMCPANSAGPVAELDSPSLTLAGLWSVLAGCGRGRCGLSPLLFASGRSLPSGLLVSALSRALSPLGRATAIGERRIATVADGAAVPLVLCAAPRAERGGPGGSIGGKSAVRARPSVTEASSKSPKTKVRRGLPPSPRGARGERAASPRIRSAEEPPVNPGPPGTTKSTHPLAGRADPSGAARADGIKNPDRRSQRQAPAGSGSPSGATRAGGIKSPSRWHQEPAPTASNTRADGIKNPSRWHQEPEPMASRATVPIKKGQRDPVRQRGCARGWTTARWPRHR